MKKKVFAVLGLLSVAVLSVASIWVYKVYIQDPDYDDDWEEDYEDETEEACDAGL